MIVAWVANLRQRGGACIPGRRCDSTSSDVLYMFLSMEQRSLFPDTRPALSDDEIAEVLRQAILRGRRWHRAADLYLAGICAEHLVDELRGADLEVVRCLAATPRE